MSGPAGRGPTVVDPRRDRSCYKCGRAIGPDETICEVCNRAGMATPSASQYHGTVAVAIIVAVVLLAAAASLGMRGIGPYSATPVRFALGGDGAVLASVAVRNEGTRPGRAKCELRALDASGRALAAANTVSPEVAGGASVTFEQQIPGAGSDVASVSVSCQ